MVAGLPGNQQSAIGILFDFLDSLDFLHSLMAIDKRRLRAWAKKLQINIGNLNLLEQALTHRSFLGESNGSRSNERLEFLGDAVLGLVVCEYLYRTYEDRTEGELAKAKAVAVSEPVLADASKHLGLDKMILMSAGEEASGGRDRLSILADTFEAIVAVVYLDSGLDNAKEFCLRALESILIDIERQEHIRDYKSLLQELTQGRFKKAPRYVVIKEQGADHDKTFLVEARLDGDVLGVGTGKSKKQAEQAAALEALEKCRTQLQSEHAKE
ncbi:MAG TPA: ribonuclease III [Armatimonadota bacterium]|nr:ribonuclease III [Armatimonadota bacterium]